MQFDLKNFSKGMVFCIILNMVLSPLVIALQLPEWLQLLICMYVGYVASRLFPFLSTKDEGNDSAPKD